MSTIPKEIIEKIDDILVDYYHCDTYPRTRAVEDICELFSNNQLATDGREELEKENANMKSFVDRELKMCLDQITALQSQCTEKDQEIERQDNEKLEWKGMYYNAAKILEELKAENARLQKIVDIVNDRPDL